MRTVADNENQAILDIGVNVGQSLLDIKELLPKSTYYGFEPNPACVFYVNELIRLNDLPRSFVLPFGLGDREELMELKSRGWDDASSSVVERKGEHYSTTIFTTRGDDFIKKQEPTNIAFIKIDTEGFEYFVLRGLSETIKKHLPILFCEVDKNSPRNAELYDLLTEWDYEVYGEEANLGSERQSSANFKNTFGNDYIFVHSSRAKGFMKNFENQ